MAAAVETEAQKYIKEHGPAPRAVPELDEALDASIASLVVPDPPPPSGAAAQQLPDSRRRSLAKKNLSSTVDG